MEGGGEKKGSAPIVTLSKRWRIPRHTREGAPRHPARLAGRIQGQIERFSGKVSKGLAKPAADFVSENEEVRKATRAVLEATGG